MRTPNDIPGAADLGRLIGLIYDAAIDPARWPVFVQQLTEALGATDAAEGLSITLAGNALLDGAAGKVVSFFGAANSRNHDTDAQEFLQVLRPHLERAVQLNARLAHLEMRLESDAPTFDGREHGALLVDPQGRLLLANPAAEEILSSRAGLRLDGRRLAAGRTADTASLRRLILAAAQGGAGGSLAIDRAARPCQIVLVAPSRMPMRRPVSEQRVARVLVKDLERPWVVSLHAFEQYFGLTPAQGATAREIINGSGVSAVASRLGISYATARSHLLEIFRKTGVRRQAELVSLLCRWNEGTLGDQGASSS